MSEEKIDLFVTDETLTSSARRTELALLLLGVLSDHDSDSEIDHNEHSISEAIAVLFSVAAYVAVDFQIPELKFMSEMRNMYKQMAVAEKRLGPRRTARDVFTEISVMAEDDPEKPEKPKKKRR